ncbi:MAG: hypothetical protein AAGC55_18880, partial [Myxococcota bacterium]
QDNKTLALKQLVHMIAVQCLPGGVFHEHCANLADESANLADESKAQAQWNAIGTIVAENEVPQNLRADAENLLLRDKNYKKEGKLDDDRFPKSLSGRPDDPQTGEMHIDKWVFCLLFHLVHGLAKEKDGLRNVLTNEMPDELD